MKGGQSGTFQPSVVAINRCRSDHISDERCRSAGRFVLSPKQDLARVTLAAEIT
jgi:hypothetical protein